MPSVTGPLNSIYIPKSPKVQVHDSFEEKRAYYYTSRTQVEQFPNGGSG